MSAAPDPHDLALDRDAVLWRNSGDLRTMLVLVRALVLPVAYPMVGAVWVSTRSTRPTRGDGSTAR